LVLFTPSQFTGSAEKSALILGLGLPFPRMMRRRNIFVDELKASFQKLKPELAIDLGPHVTSFGEALQ